MSAIDRRALLRVMLGGGAAAATVGLTAIMSPAAAMPPAPGPGQTLTTQGSAPIEAVEQAAVVVTRPRPRRRVRRRTCFWRAGRRVCRWRWVWI
jgi:hypothetical protein